MGQLEVQHDASSHPSPDFIQRAQRDLQTTLLAVNRFKSEHPLELLFEASPEQIADTANALQEAVAGDLGVDPNTLRRVNHQRVEAYRTALARPGAATAVVRHGAQAQDRYVHSLKGTPDQKIEMMSGVRNWEDPLTLVSMAESAGTGLVWAIAAAQSSRKLHISTSPNARAEQVAQIAAEVAGVTYRVDASFRCVDYPIIERSELIEILDTKDGGLSYARIDLVCGPGTLERHVKAVQTAIASTQGDELRIVVGHTQHLQVTAMQYGVEDKPIGSKELGWHLVGGPDLKVVTFDAGVYV